MVAVKASSLMMGWKQADLSPPKAPRGFVRAPKASHRADFDVLSQYPGRIAAYDGAWRHVLEHHSASPHDALIPDRHAGQYRAAAADEASSPDAYRAISSSKEIASIYQCLECNECFIAYGDGAPFRWSKLRRQRHARRGGNIYAEGGGENATPDVDQDVSQAAKLI
jgi:hypothetical protein